MKKVYIKKLISLVMVLLVIFPTLGLSSFAEAGESIKSVYFQDDNGNMVFVDYSEAIDQSIAGNLTLYNAIKEYVGIAETKGRPIYLETNTGKVIDYRLAMLDNIFTLKAILGNEKYEVTKAIKCTHELKVVNEVAVIVEIKEEIDSNYTIEINGPGTLKTGETGNFDVRAYGDNTGNVNYRAIYEYTITGGTGNLEYRDGDNWIELPLTGYFGPSNGFTLTPNWDVTTEIRFTPDKVGLYSIEMSLKDLDKNKVLTDAEYGIIVNAIEEPAELVSITPVNGITVETGTTETEAIALLPKTTTIIDNKEASHIVDLIWTIDNYNGDVEGDYNAIGRFDLPEAIKNSAALELKVETIVKVVAPVVSNWPIEVEDVFVGKSDITGNTYANIKIKQEYVSVVEDVYVDNELAINMVDEPSQWRIQVGDGTTVEMLKGKITVEVEVEIILPEFKVDSLLGKGFSLGNIVVDNTFAGKYKKATQYAIVYTVGGSDTTVTTGMTELGKASKDLVQFIKGETVINIILYDANGNEIATIEDVMK